MFIDGRENSEEKRKIEPMHIKSGLYPSFFETVEVLKNKNRQPLGAQAFEYNDKYVPVGR